MENEHRISRQSLLLEARLALRKHKALDAAIITRVCELPEEDFCDNSRESFQLGAGYAYMKLGDEEREWFDTKSGPLPRTTMNAEHLLDAFDKYFAIQPSNRSLPMDEAEQIQKEIMFAVLNPTPQALTTSQTENDHPAAAWQRPFHPTDKGFVSVDPYEVEAAAAFLEGYTLVFTGAY